MSGPLLDQFALTTVERVEKEATLLPGHDQQVEIIHRINGVSARFENACQRRIRSRTWTHDGTTDDRITPEFPDVLYLEAPITSVTVLKLQDSANALTVSSDGIDGDFIVHAERGEIVLTRGLTFPYVDLPTVVLTYVAGYVGSTGTADEKRKYGWETVASDVQEMVARQVAFEYRKTRTNTAGIESISTEGVTVSYGTKPWLPEVKDTIGKYTLPR